MDGNDEDGSEEYDGLYTFNQKEKASGDQKRKNGSIFETDCIIRFRRRTSDDSGEGVKPQIEDSGTAGLKILSLKWLCPRRQRDTAGAMWCHV